MMRPMVKISLAREVVARCRNGAACPIVPASLRLMKPMRACLMVILMSVCGLGAVQAAELVGTSVIPHRIEPAMRYRKAPDPELAARVQLFIKGPASPAAFHGRKPAELLASGDWAWHDLATAVPAPDGALTVWSFNGKSSRWGCGQTFRMQAEGLSDQEIAIKAPASWISAATFLSSDGAPQPDRVLVHVANDSDVPLELRQLRLWLPKEVQSWQTLWPQPPADAAVTIPPRDKGFVQITTGPLPLSYAAIELAGPAGSLWAHLRVRSESFAISGGWVGEHVRHESFLRFLASLHVDTAHMGKTDGYTDNKALYDRWPLKLFNKLPPEEFDRDEWLPRLHAVEFLGEPQYGGGRPVPPQEVFDQLLPWRASRLATTVTHSEERIWRWYAGLSDFPHYDAYRVVAPSPDAWGQYDRWDGRRIRWGAPLETIGDMCRSLRELNRPMACAYWSQGPHHGWSNAWDGRKRRAPTPDELRAQALHGISSRITSLYWFNLSRKSLLRFPDTWDAMRRIGREIRMLEPLLLAGDAYRFVRLPSGGRPDWELASIAAPAAAVLFALDVAYQPDPAAQVFAFGPPRPATFRFALPSWLRNPVDVFRVDADGIHPAEWKAADSGIEITGRFSRDAIFVASSNPETRPAIADRHRKALDHEAANTIDQQSLESIGN